jgi:hypothetical protein
MSMIVSLLSMTVIGAEALRTMMGGNGLVTGFLRSAAFTPLQRPHRRGGEECSEAFLRVDIEAP